MDAEANADKRQDCRFAQRSCPKGEAHGCAECTRPEGRLQEQP
jgi:hypothetical protein